MAPFEGEIGGKLKLFSFRLPTERDEYELHERVKEKIQEQRFQQT
jgi:hypothetical protein